MTMIEGYIRGKKTQKATNKQIKTTIYNILRNTEAIGQTGMKEETLLQRTQEHMEEIRLITTQRQIQDCLSILIYEKQLCKTKEGYIHLLKK